ncbi:2-aminoethylphosphonate--pyruvate transaminase [subsurface metagenome]
MCVNGVFGDRMCDNVERCGATVVRVDAPWGEPIDPARVREALQSCSPKLVAIVHAETSTGVLQPLEEIGKLAHDAGALLLVDTVTSLGGIDVRVDEWGIDAVYSGTQKCISAPPGLAPVSFSPRALAVMKAKKTKCKSWYLDLSMVRKYWEGAKRAYHHTAPISMIYSLHEALRLIHEEGLETRFARHRSNHELLRDGLQDEGGAVRRAQGFVDARRAQRVFHGGAQPAAYKNSAAGVSRVQVHRPDRSAGDKCAH